MLSSCVPATFLNDIIQLMPFASIKVKRYEEFGRSCRVSGFLKICALQLTLHSHSRAGEYSPLRRHRTPRPSNYTEPITSPSSRSRACSCNDSFIRRMIVRWLVHSSASFLHLFHGIVCIVWSISKRVSTRFVIRSRSSGFQASALNRIRRRNSWCFLLTFSKVSSSKCPKQWESDDGCTCSERQPQQHVELRPLVLSLPATVLKVCVYAWGPGG